MGQFTSAWEFESKRIKVKKQPIWKHRIILYVIAQSLFMLGIGLLFGVEGFLFQLGQSMVGFMFLEIVNYIEHYGLQRRRLPNGRYEKVQPVHSWNANHKISNLVLFKLQRHSDHHANALRRYQILRDFQDAPQLPYGYPTMVLVALVPPLWSKMMDPKVDSFYEERKSS